MSEKEGNKFERMLRLISILSERESMPGYKIADRLGVSKRSIQRYIENINLAFDDEIIESSRAGYKLMDTRFLDRLKGLNDYSVIAAINTTPFGDILNNKPFIRKSLVNKIIPRIEISKELNQEKLRPIFDALKENRQLTINYNKSDGTIGKYNVLPLKLILNSGFYYLQLFDFGYNKLLQFTVNKIESMESGEIFKDNQFINKKIDYINSKWGFMADDQKNYIATVTFETDYKISELFQTNPLHKSQQYENQNGKHIFKLDVHNAQEFVRWSYRYGNRITILDPQWVIDIVKNEAKSLLRKYNS